VRPNVLTVISIAVVACAGADVVHELFGHGVSAWLVGDRILSISTVALQTAEANRFVSASGTAANCIAGVISFILLRRATAFGAAACFLWLFGAFNFCNSGYLVFSALLNSGDWAAVIAGLAPHLLWRSVLGLAGVTVYGLGLRWAADSMRGFVEIGDVAPRDVRRLVVPAYVAGGLLVTAASVVNPIGPDLILIAGVGASFGLNFGLLFIPRMVVSQALDRAPATRAIPFSASWLSVAVVVAIAYIAVLGPGIPFAP
jgi:hypothetical protein